VEFKEERQIKVANNLAVWKAWMILIRTNYEMTLKKRKT
jgi:hypothetical protein